MRDVEKVDGPEHYGGRGNPRETIKVIEGLGLGWGFSIGNALKYLTRAGRKPGESSRDDLYKALWYIRRAIAVGARGEPARDSEWESTVVLLVPLAGETVSMTGPTAQGWLQEVPPDAERPWSGPAGRWYTGGKVVPLLLWDTPFKLPVAVIREVPNPSSKP